MAPVVRRVLIVDPSPAPARALDEVVRSFGSRNVHHEADDEHAFHVCDHMAPTLILMERNGPRLDGERLAWRIRSSRLECRAAPIIMISGDATTSAILGARDAGVHEFLVKPFTAGDLGRRILNVATKPRDWIEGEAYTGPDRRRFNSGAYAGPRKRAADKEDFLPVGDEPNPADLSLDQASKGMVAALIKLEADPSSLEMLMGQAQAIKVAALATRRRRLAVAAAELHAACATHGASPGALAGPVQMVVAAIEAVQTPNAA